MRRDSFIAGSLAAFSALPFRALAASDPHAAALADIEKNTGGRLGVAALDVRSGRKILYRANERFAMCSTFKLLLVAAVFSRVDGGKEELSRKLRYGESDLLEYAPVTRKNVSAGSMSVRDLCAAAIEYSDNAAANLLLREIGGPHAVTAYARSLGDRWTVLNRTEPALNSAIPGDIRDTTTPASMLGDMKAIMSGALSKRSRGTLWGWLRACKTGGTLLRVGLPAAWDVGDKTGMGGAHNRAGDSDTRNDVAYVQAPHGAIIIAAYLTRSQLEASHRDAAIAGVGRLVASAFT